ncbi:MAG TPA: hypothetical protein ENJ95_12550 [Bacteroidetes bacterium]|nr:hypothetical protein [Bacteroidota bacterium]
MKVFFSNKNKTMKGMRQWRFNSIEEMDEKLILEYIAEAIQNQKEGKEIRPAKNKALEIPAELAQCFSENKILENKFNQLSLSKKRDYAEYISSAKKAETKARRLEKILPMILEGIGLNDKYIR